MSTTADSAGPAAVARAPRPARAATEPPADSQHAFLTGALDRMIERFAGGDHRDTVAAARQEYDARRGRVFEDEALWESWSQAFIEWYLTERPLAAGPAGPRGRPPAAHAVMDAAGREASPWADPRARAAARAWLTSHRSLFEVRALRAGRVELLDLVGGGQFSVREPRAMLGVSAGDVAEMRLIGFEDEVLFGRTFCFHPAGTRDAIAARARRMRADGHTRQDIVDFCASLRLRCERYRHVAPARIYASAQPGDGVLSGAERDAM